MNNIYEAMIPFSRHFCTHLNKLILVHFFMKLSGLQLGSVIELVSTDSYLYTSVFLYVQTVISMSAQRC